MESTEYNQEYNTASMGKRFANYLIDFIFLVIFNFIVGIILGIIIAVASPDSLYFIEAHSMFFNYIIAFIASIIYYTSFEYYTGRSVAKYITKTKVITTTGEHADFKTILIRSLCRFIPFDAFSFLFYDGTGWHDKFSNTIVVDTE